MTTAPRTLWTEVREHIDTEAGVLTWIQADTAAAGAGATPEFTDLDSFTFVQLLLSLESAFDVELLEDLGDFSGESFDDVADFVTKRVALARGGAAGD